MNYNKDLKNYSIEELQELFLSLNEKPFHAKQVFQWIYREYTENFDKMTNLSKSLRFKLKNTFKINPLKTFNRSISKDKTEKFVWKLEDGHFIESVAIPDEKRLTLCISSQVGCKMNCSFCATAKIGFKKNLTVNEIISQVWSINKLYILENKKITTNIVFMGMGEPLDNLDTVIKAANILIHPHGFNISQRKVTISTVGITKHFEKIAKSTKVNLAISLHTPDNKLRNILSPINKKYNLENLMENTRKYYDIVKKPITFEYTIIKDINDSLIDAKNLVKLLNKIPCKINLIPFNPHKDSNYKKPDINTIKKFQSYLLKKGIRTLLRMPRGEDINGACGQLIGEHYL